MGNIEHSTWHDEFDRCPGCGHATVGLQRPWGIHHATGCEVAEFMARTTTHPGAVACRDALAKLVRAEYPSTYSLSEIAETWGEGLTDDERAALREWGQ